MSKNDKKRKKFQAQDSVLKESINASQARENHDTLWFFLYIWSKDLGEE